MSRHGGSDSREVVLLGEAGACTVKRQVRGAGISCGGVQFFSKQGNQGGTLGLRMVRMALGGRAGDEEGGEACKLSVEPGVEVNPAGESRRLRNNIVFR